MANAFSAFDLTGKGALVTGGATGIGFNIARGLSAAGAKVIIASRREKVLEESAKQLSKETGNQVVYSTVDLSDQKSVEKLAENAERALGNVDIFVGNAALDAIQSLENIDYETTDRLLQVNLAANIHLFRLLMPGMRQRKWGRAIFSSSVTALCGADSVGVYSATKAGLEAFARSAAVEVGRQGITVNALVFGFFFTEMLHGAIEQREKQDGPGSGQRLIDDLSKMNAIGRPCRPDEVEGITQLLASNAGSAITGSSILVDAGMSIMLRPWAG